ncbi:MAG: alanine--glyoxylate aminotransferase family protein [Firmicutes bacterium]|jgi:aspartate aminotransferase-like enzyme|nr:alanine--glyoxylate aminotransferase family protein [Bacillota bacterium]
MNKILLTPGPVEVKESVRRAMARPMVNADLDPEFLSFFNQLTDKFKKLLKTENDIILLNGEGIIGLEAAVVNIVEAGDQVLVLDNGYFGKGFADFVSNAGGVPVILSKDYNQAFTAEDLEKALDQHPKVKAVTMVHCDTPSAMLNPIEELALVCQRRQVISIIDAVASMAAEPIETDQWGVDILLGGSQKALSAPPGMTILAISDRAWQRMYERKEPYKGFYLNLLIWKNGWLKDGKEFPYTQPVSDLYALDEAVNLALAEGDQLFQRHQDIAEATRQTLLESGFSLMPEENCRSNTVTAFNIPEGIADQEFRNKLWQEYGIMIGGSWGPLAGKIWRIGHMGEGARAEKLFLFFTAFAKLLKAYGLDKPEMAEVFVRNLNKNN